jgi:SpoVK/Ycf46/Vps4 family AAA+-type ATPase
MIVMKRFFFFLMVMVHVANLAAEKDMKVLNADDYKNYIERFNKDDEELYVQYIPNESVWNFLKQNIESHLNMVKLNMLRAEQGIPTEMPPLHMVFMGNPGTGKTTVADFIGEIYASMGLLSIGRVIKVERKDLVGTVIGETEQKTAEILKRAQGNVLFIDEAYALNSDADGDFGQEAIDTLLKIMEDERDRLVVIVAGYNDLMEQFLDSNPGLRSRFSKFIQFVDYSEMELYEIFALYCKQQDYILAAGTQQIILDKIRNMKEINMQHFANARTVRNYFEKVISNQANRMIKEYDLSGGEDALITITAEDL